MSSGRGQGALTGKLLCLCELLSIEPSADRAEPIDEDFPRLVGDSDFQRGADSCVSFDVISLDSIALFVHGAQIRHSRPISEPRGLLHQ